MKRSALLIALMAAAGCAFAQAPKQVPPEERQPAKPAPRLNLKLDNPGQYAREVPRDDKSADNLPTLGGNARPLPKADVPVHARPYPVDSERANQ